MSTLLETAECPLCGAITTIEREVEIGRDDLALVLQPSEWAVFCDKCAGGD